MFYSVPDVFYFYTCSTSIFSMRLRSMDLIGPIAASLQRLAISAPEYPSDLLTISVTSSSLNKDKNYKFISSK